MLISLPFDDLMIPVRQSGARLNEAMLKRFSCVLLHLPASVSDVDWNALPQGALLRRLYQARPRKSGDYFHVRVGTSSDTDLWVLIVGHEVSPFKRLQDAGKFARAALAGQPAGVLLAQHGLAEDVAASVLLASVAALQAAAFRLPQFKSAVKRAPRIGSLQIAHTKKLKDLAQTQASAAGNNLARWLTALPANILDAHTYRTLARQFAKRLGLGFKFYGEPQLKRLGAGAFLAVSQGNANRDAGIVRLTYRPRGARSATVSLVGKGICFDTGGTNLKPHKSMLDMHTDMEGSAVALGSLYALCLLKHAQPLDCWLAITENRIGAKAYKPQDVVRAANGTTIQVIHTDAEGRMVLADALCLAARANPQGIIDYATLTGACVYALTERYSGAFTNRPGARGLIETAGVSSGERVWCFPMDDDYETDLESGIADVMQCAVEGRGDHILAARFLKRFVPEKTAWLHLDLSAGTRSGGLAHIGTDITGFGVRYTLELLRRGWPRVAPA
jgi:leucyl aminopeptidase